MLRYARNALAMTAGVVALAAVTLLPGSPVLSGLTLASIVGAVALWPMLRRRFPRAFLIPFAGLRRVVQEGKGAVEAALFPITHPAIWSRALDATVIVETTHGLGTGVAVVGGILTSAHLVRSNLEVQVGLLGVGVRIRADVAAADDEKDLALLVPSGSIPAYLELADVETPPPGAVFVVATEGGAGRSYHGQLTEERLVGDEASARRSQIVVNVPVLSGGGPVVSHLSGTLVAFVTGTADPPESLRSVPVSDGIPVVGVSSIRDFLTSARSDASQTPPTTGGRPSSTAPVRERSTGKSPSTPLVAGGST